MALPDTDVVRVQERCDARVPEHVREQLRVVCAVDPLPVTLFETRPAWDAAGRTRMPVARPRYVASSKERSLCCVTGHGDFRLYDPPPRAGSVTRLLGEIDRDPTCVLCG